jgi:hypothetical protein
MKDMQWFKNNGSKLNVICHYDAKINIDVERIKANSNTSVFEFASSYFSIFFIRNG